MGIGHSTSADPRPVECDGAMHQLALSHVVDPTAISGGSSISTDGAVQNGQRAAVVDTPALRAAPVPVDSATFDRHLGAWAVPNPAAPA